MPSYGHINHGGKMKDELRKFRQQLLSDIETDDQRMSELRIRRIVNFQKLKHYDALLGISDTMSMRYNTTKLLDECERFLRASSKPVHATILYKHLMDIGIPLPGSGTVANLLTRLWRSPRFKRIAPGTYIPS